MSKQEIATPPQTIQRKRARAIGGRRLWLALAFIVGVAGYASILRLYVIPHFPGGIDFYTVWKAAQTLLVFHRDPYSQQVTQAIQQDIYGHQLASPQGEYLFVYPLYFLLLLFPLAWLTFPDALAWWLAFLQIGSIIILALLLNHYRLGQRPLTRAFYLLWGLLLYPSIVSFWVGQPAILVFLLFGLAWYAFCHHRDWLAGVCLGLLAIKLYIVVLPLGCLLLYALSRRRFTVVFGCIGVAASLIGLSFMIQPTWLAGFLNNTAEWNNTTEVLSHDRSVLQLCTDLLGAPLSFFCWIAALIGLGAWLFRIWIRAIRQLGEAVEFPLMVSFLLQAIIFPHQHIPNQMLLLIPGCFVLAQLQARRQQLLFFASALSLFFLPWLMRVLIPSQFTGSPWIIVPIPLILCVVLLLVNTTPRPSEPEQSPTEAGPAIAPKTA